MAEHDWRPPLRLRCDHVTDIETTRGKVEQRPCGAEFLGSGESLADDLLRAAQAGWQTTQHDRTGQRSARCPQHNRMRKYRRPEGGGCAQYAARF